ncbi:hypothetical protein ACHAXM_008587 [Skeletonema potamos]
MTSNFNAHCCERVKKAKARELRDTCYYTSSCQASSLANCCLIKCLSINILHT